MRIGRAVLSATVTFALLIGGGGAAWAGPGGSPPDGWDLKKTDSGYTLTWHAPAPVPVGGALVGFYAGDRLLGHPATAPDRRSLRLTVAGAAPSDLDDLRVKAGNRRLDEAAAAAPRTNAAPVQAAAVLPPNPVDPGVAGSFTTISGEYTLPDLTLPGFAAPVEMRGYVVAPQGTSGSRPLVLILHGRYATCYQGTSPTRLEWPCSSGWTPIPSFRGFERTQQLLASQGYVTVSISANGVNAQDTTGLPPTDGGAQARSSLVRTHLSRWADWAGSGRPSAPAIVRSAPVPDLTRVLLVGHSRGGEGVSRAALDSLTPPPAGQDGYTGTVRWQIRGLAMIGPTLTGQNPAPDVPSMVILPGCDGDVNDLEGQLYADATRGVSRGFALHSAVHVTGANHNYFNTEWTPGLAAAPAYDDYPSPYDPTCRSSSTLRLTPTVQQNVGATYVAAAAATFVAGNDQVRPLIDGSGFRAPSADPAVILTSAVGGNRQRLLVPDTSTVVSGSGARVCEQVVLSSSTTGCDTSTSPNFVAFEGVRPEAGRYAVQFQWPSAGTVYTVRPPSPVSISSSTQLALRLLIGGGTTGTQLDVAITDSSGRRAVLGSATLDGVPWPTQTYADWAQEVRFPLSPATSAGLNLSQIASLEITPRTASLRPAWLVDAWGWRSGIPSPQPVSLPRVDLGELTVQEGNSGTVTYQVPARVTRTSSTGSGQVRVFVVNPATGAATATVVSVPSGSTSISVPIQVTGNTTPGDGRTYLVAVKPVTGVFTGDVYGQLVVQDDDA
jgi:hypothetical protein